MSNKWYITLLMIGIFLSGFSVLVWALTPIPVAAQCGSNPPPDSSCITCHASEAPIDETSPWHSIHAEKDCCVNCHGGNCRASDKDQAHMDVITNPLGDIYTNCHTCHPDDYQARAEIFASDLGITPGSISTPTPVPSGKILAKPLVILSTPASTTPSTPTLPGVIGGLVIMTLFVSGLITLVTNLRNQS
jgi:hypothetical protein